MKIFVAICDHEENIARGLARILGYIFDELEIDVRIHYFSSGEALDRKLSAETYYCDLLFLDVGGRPGCKTGIEMGRRIRNVYENHSMSIIYISQEIDYSIQLFDTRPFHFLLKPLVYKQVEQVVQLYLKVVNPWDGEFTYRVDHSLCRVKRKDIVFLESADRKIVMHLINGRKETFYGALKDVYQELKFHDFLHIHASYVVNYNYIAKFKYAEVCLTTGDSPLPISQSRRRTAREDYLSIVKRRST